MHTHYYKPVKPFGHLAESREGDNVALLTYQDFYRLNKTGFLDTETLSRHCKPKRTKKELYVVIQENVPPELVNNISQAFSDWEPFVPLVFIKNSDPGGGAQPDVRVGFFKRDHGDGFPFDGPGNVLAHASNGQGDIMHFDAEENWRVGAVAGAFDVGSVAMHEIGHLLGLAHSPDKTALMYAYIGAGEIKPIADDDKDGMRDLYYWS
uniref:Peptidase metallopeptidase domain-containing protein n=1 Tax=Kalanchoe fedtschenkoi TaxID=63787 RepID=A0A7N0UG21_KALFE